MSLDLTLLQSETHLRELRADATRLRLAALATCCQPSWWGARWHAARETLRTAVRARRTPAACCT